MYYLSSTYFLALTILSITNIYQFGGNADRNKKVGIPARPYLKLTEDDINQILEVTKDYLS